MPWFRDSHVQMIDGSPHRFSFHKPAEVRHLHPLQLVRQDQSPAARHGSATEESPVEHEDSWVLNPREPASPRTRGLPARPSTQAGKSHWNPSTSRMGSTDANPSLLPRIESQDVTLAAPCTLRSEDPAGGPFKPRALRVDFETHHLTWSSDPSVEPWRATFVPNKMTLHFPASGQPPSGLGRNERVQAAERHAIGPRLAICLNEPSSCGSLNPDHAGHQQRSTSMRQRHRHRSGKTLRAGEPRDYGVITRTTASAPGRKRARAGLFCLTQRQSPAVDAAGAVPPLLASGADAEDMTVELLGPRMIVHLADGVDP